MPENFARPSLAQWANRRVSVFLVIFLLVSLGLALRLLDLGVLRGEYYHRLSEQNYILSRSIDAPRGTIHDRHGRTLAFNRATFSVSMSPGNLTTETIRASLVRLEELLDEEFLSYYDNIVKLRPRWRSRRLSNRLTLDQATAILEQRFNLPGIQVQPAFQRFYRYDETLCHILGYVGKIGPGQWNREDELYQRLGYEMDDELGVTGIESAYEDVLRGMKGLEQVEQNGRGRIIRSNMKSAPIPGDRIYLTIDLDLQQQAESLLAGREGVILACDPRNGQMLAWASAPGFNVNYPTRIDNASSQPHINRAVQEYYQPGSTFKVFTALTGLENGWSSERIVKCEHNFYIPRWSRPFRCLGYHRDLDLRDALKKSCNVYFYTLAWSLYREDTDYAGYQLVNLARHYGFGEITGLKYQPESRSRGFGEKPGSLPLQSQLRRERGSVLNLAIGQGLIEITPLQMLMAYCAVANGGELLQPILVKEKRSDPNKMLPQPPGMQDWYIGGPGDDNGDVIWTSSRIVRRKTGLTPETCRIIIEGLFRAVNEEGGTASSAGFDPAWRVAGKTSTAEQYRNGPADAWFIGFAPAENPEIAVLIMVEEGGSGGRVAAPLAVRVFQRYFEMRNRDATRIAAH